MRLTERWFVAVLLIVSVLTLPFTALAAPVRITFWHAMGGEHGEVLSALVKEFNQANPDIEVRAEYQGNYGVLMQKLLGGVVAGKPPTVAQVYSNWTAEFVESDTIVPVEKFLSDSEHGMSEADLNDFLPALLEANTWNGTLYTLPFNKSVQILYYNAKLLEEAGVSVPTTWAELRSVAKAVTEKTGVKGLMLAPGIDSFGAFFYQAGGTYVDKDGKLVFDGEAGVKALQYLYDLTFVDKSVFVHDGWLDEAFNKGDGAMFIHSNATIPWVRSGAQFAWGTAPIPSDVTQVGPVAGTDLAIFAKTTAAEQQAAWRFLKWLTSTEATTSWSMATGYIPVRTSAVDSDQMKSFVAENPSQNAASLDVLKALAFDPGITAWNDLRGYMSEAVQKVLLQGVSPEAALKDAKTKGERALTW